MINPNSADNFYMQGNAQTVANEFAQSNIDDFENDSPYDETDGIALLVQTVKQGKMDPWKIDIVDIADKYMLNVAKSKINNLKLSGRTLFFLAVLLKLKSNILVGLDSTQFDGTTETYNPEFDDDSRFSDDMYDEDIINNKVISIDDVLQRRTSIKLNRNRVVTLKDLIRQLQFYEELDRKQSLQNSLERAKRRIKSYANLTSDDIINIAHDEYIEKSVKVLHENLIKIFEKEEKVELNTLTLLGLDKISAYIALLFLTAESDFDLEQKEFYSDLYVVKEKHTDNNLEVSA